MFDEINLTPEARHLLKFFNYGHLRPDRHEIAKCFQVLAQEVAMLPANPETLIALRNLLSAKEAVMRSLTL